MSTINKNHRRSDSRFQGNVNCSNFKWQVFYFAEKLIFTVSATEDLDDVQIVQLLLDYGADIDYQSDHQGWFKTALMVAGK